MRGSDAMVELRGRLCGRWDQNEEVLIYRERPLVQPNRRALISSERCYGWEDEQSILCST